MVILSLETASYAEASAALLKDGEILCEKTYPMGRDLSSQLVPELAEMTKENIPDLIVVDRGPGSFTGIRTGLAAAQGLALGWGAKLAGVPFFDYYPRAEKDGDELLLLNARAGGGFYYEYRRAGKCEAGYAIKEELSSKFPNCLRYYGECDETTFPEAQFVPLKIEFGAKILAALALKKLEKGEAAPPEAIYLHLRAALPRKTL